MNDIQSDFPEQSITGKRYRILEDGNREYESGTIFDPVRNKIVSGPITKENAGIMQRASRIAIHDKAVESARLGLLRGVAATQLVDDPHIAWSHVIEAQTELAMTPDMGHASTGAAKLVGQATQMLDKQEVSVGKVEVNVLSLDAAREIIGILGNVVDAEWKEDE